MQFGREIIILPIKGCATQCPPDTLDNNLPILTIVHANRAERNNKGCPKTTWKTPRGHSMFLYILYLLYKKRYIYF